MGYKESAYEFRSIAHDCRRLLNDSQAEIARLQAELERLTIEAEWAYAAAENSLLQVGATRNAAIEEAAMVADRQPVANSIAQRIRALKRPT